MLSRPGADPALGAPGEAGGLDNETVSAKMMAVYEALQGLEAWPLLPIPQN
jgi:hypothetical protein